MSAMPERYEPDEHAEGGPCMAASEYGQWVALCDYATLESRLLAAEAERHTVARLLDVANLEIATLRAERAALVPLAAYGYNDLEMDCPSGPWPLVPNDEERAAARAVLARHQEGV